jgi:putative effector of murein hydrolase LrgA (UPF0299 family)
VAACKGVEHAAISSPAEQRQVSSSWPLWASHPAAQHSRGECRCVSSRSIIASSAAGLGPLHGHVSVTSLQNRRCHAWPAGTVTCTAATAQAPAMKRHQQGPLPCLSANCMLAWQYKTFANWLAHLPLPGAIAGLIQHGACGVLRLARPPSLPPRAALLLRLRLLLLFPAGALILLTAAALRLGGRRCCCCCCCCCRLLAAAAFATSALAAQLQDKHHMQQILRTPISITGCTDLARFLNTVTWQHISELFEHSQERGRMSRVCQVCITYNALCGCCILLVTACCVLGFTPA